MVSPRLSRATGHQCKFLAIIDGTPESSRALSYASRRAKNTQSSLLLLYVIDDTEFQHILGVGDVMRTEACEMAHIYLKQALDEIHNHYKMEAETIIREGSPWDEICKLIEEDQDIALLVLAASSNQDNPGPLLQTLSRRNFAFPVPITIIPETLSDTDLSMIA